MIEATFSQWTHVVNVWIVASDELDRILWERNYIIPNYRANRRDFVRFCRSIGVTHYRIR